MKILIIRFSSIGDIVLTSPVVRCLKLQLDEVELHYLTKKSFEELISNNIYVDNVHCLRKKLSETISELKAEDFDYIIDLHNNIRSKFIIAQMGVKSRSFNKLNLRKFLLVNFKINTLPSRHIVDRYLDTVGFLGVRNDNKGLDYFFKKQYDLASLLPATHQNYIGLVIGAQHATKRLPLQKLIDLCQSVNKPIVLLGGKEDHIRAVEICNMTAGHVFNGCGQFSLDESAFIVSQAMKIITHDTGLMHIAAAFNKPILSVWGNTVPEFGMYPYMVSDHTLAEVKGLKCRPCSKIGYKRCPLGHFKCMNDQDIETITQTI